MLSVKEEVKKLADILPEYATWEDAVYEFYVRRKVELGLKATEEGKTVTHEEIKKRFLNK